MSEPYFSEQTFESKEFPLRGEYDCCIFKGLNFSDQDLSGYSFNECTFYDCNFSLAKILNTAFRDVKFKGCKLMGLRFEDCNSFGQSFSFEDCTLNHASFFQVKMRKTVFKNTSLLEVDFSEADLSESTFQECPLSLALFNRTNAEKCDFRTAFGYSIDPEINRLKNARFSTSGISGLLDKYNLIIED
jgi:uncharacterized protein YjbI with pentapeptide repeats